MARLARPGKTHDAGPGEVDRDGDIVNEWLLNCTVRSATYGTCRSETARTKTKMQKISVRRPAFPEPPVPLPGDRENFTWLREGVPSMRPLCTQLLADVCIEFPALCEIGLLISTLAAALGMKLGEPLEDASYGRESGEEQVFRSAQQCREADAREERNSGTDEGQPRLRRLRRRGRKLDDLAGGIGMSRIEPRRPVHRQCSVGARQDARTVGDWPG